MYALQSEINVVADNLYLFPCSKSTRSLWYTLRSSMQISHVMRARRPLALFGRFRDLRWRCVFCFQPRCHVLVSHPSHFMVQQVAALQHVTPAILIMWANKSALEENVSGQKIRRSCRVWGSTSHSGFSDAGRDERSTCSALRTRTQIQTVSMFTSTTSLHNAGRLSPLSTWLHVSFVKL